MIWIQRREFITLLGGAAAAWPLAARRAAAGDAGDRVSQRPVGRELDALGSSIPRGLNEVGYAEGRSVAIEYRWANGDIDRLPAAGGRSGRRRVAVIAATGGDPVALAVKRQQQRCR